MLFGLLEGFSFHVRLVWFPFEIDFLRMFGHASNHGLGDNRETKWENGEDQ